MIIHYIVEENIFLIIVYTLLLRDKYQSVILNIALKLMVSNCLRKVNMFNSEILKILLAV